MSGAPLTDADGWDACPDCGRAICGGYTGSDGVARCGICHGKRTQKTPEVQD